MASFTGSVITNLGIDLRSKTDAGIPLVFNRLVMGDGIPGTGTDLKTVTNLVSEVKGFEINSKQHLGDGRTQLRTTLSNAGLTAGFYAREFGIIAQDPDAGEILYAYGTADPADWIPPETEAFQQIFDTILVTGNTTDINVTLAPNLSVVTLQDMQDHEAKQLDPTDTDPVREKHLSNAQAKKWEDHADDVTLHQYVFGHEQKQVDPTSTNTAKDRHLSNAQAKVWEDHADDPLLHMGKNLLINGGFEVWQRGDSITLPDYNYCADRWASTATTTIEKTTANIDPQATYGAKLTKGANLLALLQPIELSQKGECGPFRIGEIFTLSFTTHASVAGDLGVRGFFSDVGRDSVNPVWATEIYSVTVTNTVKRHVVTFTITNAPMPTNQCFTIYIYNAAVDMPDLTISQIQLELGGRATEFEKRLPGVELALCQRYYERISPYVLYVYGSIREGSGWSPGSYQYNVAKRVTPTISNLLLRNVHTGEQHATTMAHNNSVECLQFGVVGGEIAIGHAAGNHNWVNADAEL